MNISVLDGCIFIPQTDTFFFLKICLFCCELEVIAEADLWMTSIVLQSRMLSVNSSRAIFQKYIDSFEATPSIWT